MAGQQHADRRTGGDGGAGRDRRLDRLVGRAQAARVIDADHRAAGDLPGEGDHAGTGRPDRGARRRG